MMPELNGHEVCRRLKADPRTKNVPVIFLTARGEVEDERKVLQLGAVDYIVKPVTAPIVLARVATHLQLYDQNRALEDLVKQRTEELDSSRLEIVRRLGLAAEFRDNETGMHVIRMSHYSRIVAEAIDLAPHEVDRIYNAAPMHDVGKIGIPDNILRKSGPIDDQEQAIMHA